MIGAPTVAVTVREALMLCVIEKPRCFDDGRREIRDGFIRRFPGARHRRMKHPRPTC